MINAILRLRRDNDYNYAKIKDTFIPANGEICLVDTARDGLRAVCGDGTTPFGQLEYLGEVIVKGFFFEGEFYTSVGHEEKITGYTSRIYIDILTNSMYYYNGINYIEVSGRQGEYPIATETTPGIMKLYDSVGENEDGTMSQKAITDELDDKVEITLNHDEELLIFTT